MNTLQVIAELKQGNQRFLTNTRIYPNQSLEHVKYLAEHGQTPFAVIVCCSDSRLNPMIFFDRGLGDFFIVRSAGNVLNDHSIDSIKYAVNILSVPVVLILGHTKCGAVTVAVENYNKSHHGCSVSQTIKRAVQQSGNQDGCAIENTIRNNTENMVNLLKQTDFNNPVDIISGLYDIDTGQVEFYE